jgi:signal transduction histidine kinase
MNQAVRNEQLAVRQKLMEAYRGQLAVAQKQLAMEWTQITEQLDARVERESAPAFFADCVRSGLADAIIVFSAEGSIVYPDQPSIPETHTPGAAWSEAQALEPLDSRKAAAAYARIAASADSTRNRALALQAQARCLVQGGHKVEALSVLSEINSDKELSPVEDSQGRLLAPAAELLALELIGDSDPTRSATLRTSLRTRLEDYAQTRMPAAQRRFLMAQFQRLFPGEPPFPTLAAEQLAESCLSAGVAAREPVLHPGVLEGVWEMGSPGGRVLLLHRTEELKKRGAFLLSHDAMPNVRLILSAPGEEPEDAMDTLPAGPALPGWRIALSLASPESFQSVSAQRTRIYIWIGVLCVAIVTVLMLLALGMVRRQLALTRLRNDLVANVTHELKTPLSSMRLLVDTLLESPRIEDKPAREYLEMIAAENLRLSRLIDNFLAFSRIERNKFAFQFREIPASTVLTDAAAAVRDRFAAPGCKFDVKHPGDLPVLRADRDALVTALVNLLDNAYKYSGEQKEIVLAAEAQNGCVSFSVKDNGIGIPAAETSRIFRRFYRGKSQRSGQGGAGIGLSIVEFVISAHRGTVDVQSAPGSGSTFTIRIPTLHTEATR